MKPEQEIRRHLESLRTLMKRPCGCNQAGGAHAVRCVMGGKMMTAAADSLAWALGENPGMDRLVESLDAEAKKI